MLKSKVLHNERFGLVMTKLTMCEEWEDKDVSHLKALIDLCLHWIEAEISTRKLLEDMPEGKNR